MESKKSIIIRLYRAFLLQCRRIDTFPDPRILIQTRRTENIGTYRFLEETKIQKEIANISPNLVGHVKDPIISSTELRKLIGVIFRSTSPTSENEFISCIDQGFADLRQLEKQVGFRNCTSFNESNGIRVVVTSFPVAADQGYLFLYRVRIKNTSNRMVAQLQSRQWTIKCSTSLLEVPIGSPGVVGQTPKLFPGNEFEYSSSVALTSPTGTMEGSFEMVIIGDLEDTSERTGVDEKFYASVGPFNLIFPLNSNKM